MQVRETKNSVVFGCWLFLIVIADSLCNLFPLVILSLTLHVLFYMVLLEHSGYFETKTNFVKDANEAVNGEMEFYDSNTGKLLFVAPRGRTMEEFLKESRAHGWPSFRDAEVNWDHVRCLPNGESVSLDGTHLGHNLPDKKGNRYCINLVSIAGNPM
jgi:hypothetical protein